MFSEKWVRFFTDSDYPTKKYEQKLSRQYNSS